MFGVEAATSSSGLGAALVYEWRTTGANQTLQVPMNDYDGLNYNYHVVWGDGAESDVVSDVDPAASHEYATAGDYTVTITGVFESFDLGYDFNGHPSSPNVIKVLNLGSTGLVSLYYSFGEAANLTHFTAGDTDLSGVSIMEYTFTACPSLVSVDFSDVDLSSITSMQDCFSRCTAITRSGFNFSGVDFSSVQLMHYMFEGCTSLELIPLMQSTTGVTFFASFVANSGITSFSFADLSTASATTFNGFFSGCSSLATINFFSISPDNVTDVRSMFNGCSVLTDPNWVPLTFGSITSLYRTFRNCATLTSLSMTDFNFGANNSITSLSSTFNGCTNVTDIDLFGLITTNVSTMDSAFANCPVLTQVNDLESTALHSCTTMVGLFLGSNAWLDTEYDLVLNGWEAKGGAELNNNVTVDFGDAKYSPSADAARTSLTGTYSWTIQDGGPV